MPYHDAENNWFRMAAGMVNNSSHHVFLTGKAGTGKTTFLKYIQQETFKKSAVVAPTGVAAINAGGVTMHSFFQLPFGPYVPHSTGWNNNVTNSNSLLKNIRFNQSKRELLKELELLIIDEVSMVRADMLDEVDLICRHFRKQPYAPFGGLQLLYIGDLFQLPPVVNDDEWNNILSPHYKSPFFFDAKVIEQAPPAIIELKKIYRQDESKFIHILNNIRNNTVSETDLDVLHERFDRGFEPAHGEQYITLTTHNSKADAINQQELKKLKGSSHYFNAEIDGEFSEKSFPADKQLQLKVGAQVMFIKNDKGEFRRYYNGKIATVTRIDDEGIFVTIDNDPDELLVEQETWKNIRYNYDKQSDKIEEEELGTFKQFPLRLAWAITIHKSQGLTFEKAIVDAGASFAPGQVYVALSRLTSLKGLVLFSRIHPNAIRTDKRVLEFVEKQMPEEHLQQFLAEKQKQFVSQSLIEFFDWNKLAEYLQSFQESYEDRLIPDKESAIKWFEEFLEMMYRQKEVADKFTKKLQELLSAPDIDYKHLHKRTGDAANYFTDDLKKMLVLLQQHIDEIKIKKRTKKYHSELIDVQLLITRKDHRLKQAVALAEALAFGNDTDSLLNIIESQRKETLRVNIEEPFEKQTTGKLPKGESNRISLQMFKAGNSIDTIAKERGFVVSTIESHLASFIPTGEVTLHELLPEQKINKIIQVIEELGDKLTGSKDVKDKLPPDYSFADIKAVMLHRQKENIAQ